MKTKISLVAATLIAATTLPVLAAPLAQNERDITGLFSVDVQRKFNLFADSDHRDLVWYVPKEGQVAINGATTASPKPRFSIVSRYSTSGVFAGQEQAVLGGAFDTSGSRGDLLRLESEARAKGMRISPAAASKATTNFMLSDIAFDSNGRANIRCENKPVPGTIFTVPECLVLTDSNEWVSTTVLASFQAQTPQGNTSVSTYIPFQAVSMPDTTSEMRQLMDGSTWDAHIQATTTWELTTLARTQVARININWERTFEQASTFMAIHYNSCVEAEIQTFFRRLADNANGQSGITIEYLHDDGTYRSTPPNQEKFEKVVQALYEQIRSELFVEMRDYGQSQLGRVGTEARATFTLRANYEKLIFKRNETRLLTWNPGSSITTAKTNMTLQCLKGGFGAPVTWAMDDAACRDIVGQ